jgi:hypothetical protein
MATKTLFLSADAFPCEVCGKQIADCICPPCAFCNVKGDPDCYPALQDDWHSVHGHHGMMRTRDQLLYGIEEQIKWLEKQLEYYEMQRDTVVMQDSSFRELSKNLFRRLVSK